MADAVFTLTKVTTGTLGRGMFLVADFTTDTGDYVTDGIALLGVNAFSAFSRYRREPDIVLFASENGYYYEYAKTSKKVLIKQCAAAGNPLAQLSAAQVPAGARTGVRVIALWFTPVP